MVENGITIAPEDITSTEAVRLLRVYFTELAARYWDREVTASEVDDLLVVDPSDDLAAPNGVFLVAWDGARTAGCTGLRALTPEIAELKRMFVRPEWRGRGVGKSLIEAVERTARQWGAHSIRLDTRNDLVEARGLYIDNGYGEISPYETTSGEVAPYAEHWYEKRLSTS